MKQIILAVLLSVGFSGAAHAATCMTGHPFPFKTQYALDECPADIQALLDRMNACAHFAGEEAYDADRKAQIDAAMTENQCEKLGCDFQKVFETHEGDIVYTGILFEYARVVYGSDEAVPECTDEVK